MKRMVCDALKRSWLIWIRKKESIYSMMRPRFTMEKMKKRGIKFANEGSVETHDEKDTRNLRWILNDEMSGGLVGRADEVIRCQHMMIEGSTEKDGTLSLLHANFDSKTKNKGEGREEGFIKEEQIDDMIEVADDKER
jgi:hypothetical protein